VIYGSGGSGGDTVVVEVLSSSFLCISPKLYLYFLTLLLVPSPGFRCS
jgi:hypothetical protein